MNNIFVSIIVPYYKKSKYIDKTISSILQQTYKNFEIIIIDDELSNESSSILEKIKKLDTRINVFLNQENIGAGPSRNYAINFCKGNFIAFCDSDDVWAPEKLTRQLKIMTELNLEFSHTSYEIIDEKNQKKGFRKAEKSLSFKKLLNSCDIGLSTVVIKKELFENKKYRFGKTKTKEDYILWLLLAKNGIKISGIDENLTFWRKSKNSLSSSSIQKIIDGYKVYRHYLHYNWLKSLFFLILLSINYMLKKIK